MRITLRPETERMIEQHVGDAGYPTADDAVQAALRLLVERSQDVRAVRDKIAEGVAQLERGEGVDGEAVFEELSVDLRADDGA